MKREMLPKIRAIIRKEGGLASPPPGKPIVSRREKERDSRPSTRELLDAARAEDGDEATATF